VQDLLNVIATFEAHGLWAGVAHVGLLVFGALFLAFLAPIADGIINRKRIGVVALTIAGLVLFTAFGAGYAMYALTRTDDPVLAEREARPPVDPPVTDPEPVPSDTDPIDREPEPPPPDPVTRLPVPPPRERYASCPLGTALGWVDVTERNGRVTLPDATAAIDISGPVARGMMFTLSGGASVQVHTHELPCIRPDTCHWNGVASGDIEVLETQYVTRFRDGTARWQVCVRQHQQ
jgi:hypothetical protein